MIQYRIVCIEKIKTELHSFHNHTFQSAMKKKNNSLVKPQLTILLKCAPIK